VARRIELPQPLSVDLTAVEVLPILLVDDRTENLRALESVLAPLGYPLLRANSGAEALRVLLEQDVALILLDVRMPELDGLETARLIKGRARTRDVPIVFLTAAQDDVGDIVRGYGVGAVDYLVKPFDPELLRSKVMVFTELENSRRALNRSEALLRAAFEAAPIGKTMLDSERRIVRANPAFARLVGREPGTLSGFSVAALCHDDDRGALSAALDLVSGGGDRAEADLRLHTLSGLEVWAGIVASSIDTGEFAEPLLLVQWVDLSARRRAEEARAELLMEHAARTNAEAIADRLAKLQALSGAIESLSLDQVLRELAAGLLDLFDAELAEVEVGEAAGGPVTVRAAGGQDALEEDGEERTPPSLEAPVVIEGAAAGALRIVLPPGRSPSASERTLLSDAADRASLGIRRAQLHEQEHRIAVELQRGLLPKQMPQLPGVELAAHYEVAGVGAHVGGDWYDAFTLSDGRLGIVVGDVAGRGIPAASAMGQLRSVARAFALADDGARTAGKVLTRLNMHQLALGVDELFTVVYAIVDPSAGVMNWASAGHPPLLLRTARAGTRYLESGQGLMGIEEIAYQDMRVPVGEGDIVVAYTDGLVERRGELLDVGLARLADAVVSGPSEIEPLCRHVLGTVLPAERELRDDVTAVFAKLA
jgi:PAS domain S-box-containing protein